MLNKLYVILPCYNEQENIRDLIIAWLALREELQREGYEMLITPVDDGSKDDTKCIIRQIANENEEVKLLEHMVNQGLGAGVSTGLSYFYENATTGDCAVIMDADNTHNPQFIFSMLGKIRNGMDCVIASRYCKSSKTVGVPVVRNFLSFGARIYYSIVLGVKNVRDYTCGYRIYTYDIIKKAFNVYGQELVQERGFSCMMELLYKLYKIGAKFDEVPFELRYDYKKGESKMRIMRTISSSFQTAIKLRFRINKTV